MLKPIPVAVALLCACVPLRAAALCASPSAVVLPAPGSDVPPNPVLFLFPSEPGELQALRIVGDSGQPMAFRLERLTEPPALESYRVVINAAAGTAFTLTLGERGPKGTYRVSAAWRRPPSRSVEVAKVESEIRAWTCSHQASRNLTLRGSALVYRVEWSTSVDKYRRGERKVVVLPASMNEFWSQWASGPRVTESVLQLGFVSCFGPTLEWGKEPIFIGITALYPDGSVDLPAADPMKLKPPSGKPVER